MSDQQDGADKRHDPTQRKLEDARKKGEVARSQDLNVAAAYGGMLLCLLGVGTGTCMSLGGLFSTLLDQSHSLAPLVFDGDPRPTLGGMMLSAVRPLAAWFLFPAVAVLAVNVAQRSFTFSPDKIRPKLSRISPLSNARNKYGRSGLFEFAKSFTKLVIYSVCLGLFLNARLDDLAGTLQGSAGQAILLLVEISIQFIFVATLIAASIGAIDFLWQRAEHLRKNRMSDKDLRDEQKESEGDPHMKQARRQKAQDIALNQMMADVPNADVVIVNPTHFAVALQWSRKRGEAPVCVAKGVDEIARTIRETARSAGVPIHSDPPTARALYATTEIGAEIAPDHYRSVAAAVRFAEAMRQKARRGWQ